MRVEAVRADPEARHRIGRVLSTLAVFVLTPFAVTAIYRVLPDYYSPAWHITPFLVLGVAAVAIWLWRPRWRPIAVSVIASLVIYFAFLFWLIATFPALD